MDDFGELSRPQLPEETCDNSPRKLGEKILFERLELKAYPVSMVSPINCIKDALKF